MPEKEAPFLRIVSGTLEETDQIALAKETIKARLGSLLVPAQLAPEFAIATLSIRNYKAAFDYAESLLLTCERIPIEAVADQDFYIEDIDALITAIRNLSSSHEFGVRRLRGLLPRLEALFTAYQDYEQAYGDTGDEDETHTKYEPSDNATDAKSKIKKRIHVSGLHRIFHDELLLFAGKHAPDDEAWFDRVLQVSSFFLPLMLKQDVNGIDAIARTIVNGYFLSSKEESGEMQSRRLMLRLLQDVMMTRAVDETHGELFLKRLAELFVEHCHTSDRIGLAQTQAEKSVACLFQDIAVDAYFHREDRVAKALLALPSFTRILSRVSRKSDEATVFSPVRSLELFYKKERSVSETNELEKQLERWMKYEHSYLGGVLPASIAYTLNPHHALYVDFLEIISPSKNTSEDDSGQRDSFLELMTLTRQYDRISESLSQNDVPTLELLAYRYDDKLIASLAVSATELLLNDIKDGEALSLDEWEDVVHVYKRALEVL